MKQIEVTTRVYNSLEEVDAILTKENYQIIGKYRIEDEYLTQNLKMLTAENILDILKTSVLVRYVKDDEEEDKKITYKIKEYDGDKVISEEKINVKIDDIDKAIKLFSKLNFEHLVSVKYDVVVYSNGKIELAFQNVEGLGLLLEYENSKDFTGYSSEDILKEKNKMLKQIKDIGLKISDDYDIKKAYELIKNKLNN